jgi:hypothetical protein
MAASTVARAHWMNPASPDGLGNVKEGCSTFCPLNVAAAPS